MQRGQCRCWCFLSIVSNLLILENRTPLSDTDRFLSSGSRGGRRKSSLVGHARLLLKGQRLRWCRVHSCSDHLLDPEQRATQLTNQRGPPLMVNCAGSAIARISFKNTNKKLVHIDLVFHTQLFECLLLLYGLQPVCLC